MTALAVALLVTGAALLVAEAHLASYGVLGIAGALALVAGGAIAVAEAGGSVVLALALALPVAAGLAVYFLVASRKALAARRLRPKGGAAGLIGRVGVMRHGDVVVVGELWRARSWWEEEPALREGEHVVIEQVHGLTLGVRRAEEWEVLP
jgi:membrane-bound serine protease (ClpP class)